MLSLLLWLASTAFSQCLLLPETHLVRNQESLSHSRKNISRHILEIFPHNILEASTESSQEQRVIMRDEGLFYSSAIE